MSDQPVMRERAARRRTTLGQIGRLALNPGPALKVMQADGDDPDQLIDVLSRCPILSGRVIGVANSAGSSAIHHMDTIDRCVRHLGAKQTRIVALTMAMQLMVDRLDVDQDVLSNLWGCAAYKAIAAQIVAESVSPALADQAYCVGLLQDIGLPMLLAIDPNFVTNALPSGTDTSDWVQRERAHFGIDHAELGSILLHRWNAPPNIVLQVARHHAPLEDDASAWVADLPARIAGLLPHLDEKTTEQQSQTLAAAHARFLKSDYASLDELLAKIKTRLRRLGKAAGGTPQIPNDFVAQLVQHVAGDTYALAGQVSRLDRQLADQVVQLAEARQDALSDQLTGLLNRRGFETFGQQLLNQAAKANLAVACFMIDLDDFKLINDTHGHAAGDLVLVTAAELLRTNTSRGDLVARIGGDEFAVLLIGDRQSDAHALAQRLHAVCNGKAVPLSSGQAATLAMSIGGVYQQKISQATTTTHLADAADRVMYGIKRTGKAGLKFEAIKRHAA